MSKLMKIAHLIDSLETGGAQKLLVTFAIQAMISNSRPAVSVTVISLRADADKPMAVELVQAGAKIVTFPGKGLLDLDRLARLVRFLRQEQFDILQAHLSYANILACLAGMFLSFPLVCTMHNVTWDPRHYNRVRQWLEYWLLRLRAQKVVAVGEAVAAAHQKRLNRQKLHVIANAASKPADLSPEERSILRQELLGNLTGPLLISVGRLAPQKGYSDLLKAFSMVSARYPQVRLVIAGNGSLRDELMAQIYELGTQEKVSLLGVRQDVPRLLAASDLYVSASYFEGLPISVLEAMNSGLAVVSTQVGELPLVVVPGTGLLVPPHQPERLAQAILSLLEDPALREEYSRAARLYIGENYNDARWFERYMDLYQEVIQGKNR